MKDALAGNWIPEFSISLGKRQPGFPTCYKVDLGNPGLKIAIEVDGNTHHSRKTVDEKKDKKLVSLGWIVLRFWNKDILNWINTGMPTDTYISTTLKRHGIHLSR
jgi:very-short-patch-repair endonuclease